MNVIESNIIQSNITKIFILAYEYITESIYISVKHKSKPERYIECNGMIYSPIRQDLFLTKIPKMCP